MKCLITADWHLRGDAPVCRKHPDKWLAEQAASVRAVQSICKSHGVDEVWILGDLFHRARTSTEATVQALTLLSEFPVPVRVLMGNHDLSYHAVENSGKSTIGAVFSVGNVTPLGFDTVGGIHVEAYPFGTEPEIIPSCDIWCTHQLVFPDEKSRPPTDTGVLAEELLERSDAKLILTGDYHHAFVREFGDRRVVACGCLNIQASDMADYQPCCYILDTITLGLERVDIETFGEIDTDAPLLEDANGYAETLQLASLPKLDFRAAISEAVEKAEPSVRAKVTEILEVYDGANIV